MHFTTHNLVFRSFSSAFHQINELPLKNVQEELIAQLDWISIGNKSLMIKLSAKTPQRCSSHAGLLQNNIFVSSAHNKNDNCS